MYAEIDRECPACGLKNVWMCTWKDCPKTKSQKDTRDAWVNASTSPPEDESKPK